MLSAHLAAGLLYVIDLKTNQLIKTIPDLPGVEGVEYVPDLKKVYNSDYYEDKIWCNRPEADESHQQAPRKPSRTAAPMQPFHKLYVSDERGRAEAVVDVMNDEIIRTLKFDSETGMPQYDPVARKVYVNLQDQNIFASSNPPTTPSWHVTRWADAAEITASRSTPSITAFLCEGNELMTVFDLEKHEPIAYLPMAAGPDVIKYDPGLKRIYAACYSGAISVFQEDDPEHYRKLRIFPYPRKCIVLPSI